MLENLYKGINSAKAYFVLDPQKSTSIALALQQPLWVEKKDVGDFSSALILLWESYASWCRLHPHRRHLQMSYQVWNMSGI